MPFETLNQNCNKTAWNAFLGIRGKSTHQWSFSLYIFSHYPSIFGNAANIQVCIFYACSKHTAMKNWMLNKEIHLKTFPVNIRYFVQARCLHNITTVQQKRHTNTNIRGEGYTSEILLNCAHKIRYNDKEVYKISIIGSCTSHLICFELFAVMWNFFIRFSNKK